VLLVEQLLLMLAAGSADTGAEARLEMLLDKSCKNES
jgi:hypothetical protein